MYAQGYVKGLSPFAYRGKSPDFYKNRQTETLKSSSFSYSVEPAFQYLVPSKWHKTGWKYSPLPKTSYVEDKFPSEFTSTYEAFYKPYNSVKTTVAKKPRDSIFQPCGTLKMPRLRRIMKN